MLEIKSEYFSILFSLKQRVNTTTYSLKLIFWVICTTIYTQILFCYEASHDFMIEISLLLSFFRLRSFLPLFNFLGFNYAPPTSACNAETGINEASRAENLSPCFLEV